MPLEIIRQDIIHMKVDAIINPSNTHLIKGHLESVSGQIFEVAGDLQLEQACIELSPINRGEAVITLGYKLPAKYIIHTAGPKWFGGDLDETKLLVQCYKSALDIALNYKLESIAFPLLSSGSYAFPKEEALKTAIQVLQDFVLEHDILIYLVVFDQDSFSISKKLTTSVKKYIDDSYVYDLNYHERIEYSKSIGFNSLSLDGVLTMIDDPFSVHLFKLIDSKNKKDVDVYKKSNISKAVFSKIRSNSNYQPSKSTALAFCIGLELNYDESITLLQTAGYGFSNSSKQDLIVKYFIEKKKYNIFDVNGVLFNENLQTLGSTY
jgi:O-acetyl-ADP-ribose deacetylase (regulator of RNase III)